MGDEETVRKLQETMDFSQNVSQNFKNFLQNFETFYASFEKDSKTKIDVLLKCMGQEASEIFNTFELSTEEKKDYNKIIDEFQQYCNLDKNLLDKRHKFFTRKQEEGEGIYDFYNDLGNLAKNGEFKETFLLVTDRLFLGMRNEELRDRLVETEDMSLGLALMKCRLAEEPEEEEEKESEENSEEEKE